jgi:hypothetical protein
MTGFKIVTQKNGLLFDISQKHCFDVNVRDCINSYIYDEKGISTSTNKYFVLDFYAHTCDDPILLELEFLHSDIISHVSLSDKEPVMLIDRCRIAHLYFLKAVHDGKYTIDYHRQNQFL